ncbi:circular bacteriocin, circularin A/uberolysin family [Streptococcus suis]|nr:circular bacteriocin, circularin A/uberolysin family [Streptococcus suis]NQO23753.1 circular bacteriocin, circularin A/uberolysin family [Streptococcus suis]
MMTKKKVSKLMFLAPTALAMATVPFYQSAQLASTLGINAYAAKKVIDIVSAAGTVYAVVGVVAAIVGGGGIGVALLASAKALAKRYGKSAAAAW